MTASKETDSGVLPRNVILFSSLKPKISTLSFSIASFAKFILKSFGFLPRNSSGIASSTNAAYLALFVCPFASKSENLIILVSQSSLFSG